MWSPQLFCELNLSVHFACVQLQPDRVLEFCKNNDLQLIVRAHECVMDGFERFAQGHLITLFSATNYCGAHLCSLPVNWFIFYFVQIIAVSIYLVCFT